jgi:hypothetical protein
MGTGQRCALELTSASTSSPKSCSAVRRETPCCSMKLVHSLSVMACTLVHDIHTSGLSWIEKENDKLETKQDKVSNTKPTW